MSQTFSIIEHLEEFRRRILKSLAFVALFSAASYYYIDNIFAYIAKPVGRVVFVSPPEVFLAYIKLSLFCGVLLSSPFLAYQFWRFVSSGLYTSEKRYLLVFGPLSVLLFSGGAAFGFFIVVPIAIKVLLGISKSPMITPMITVNNYVSFVGVLTIMFGVVFELPILVLLLTKLGIVNPRMLSTKRRYAILFIFIIAGVLTPPDVVSQILMAVPLLVLYEISILLAKLIYKPKDASYL